MSRVGGALSSTTKAGAIVDAALFSSASDEWSTPPDFFAAVERAFGPFDLDPCALPESAKAPHFYTAADDGLRYTWFGRVWMNPPYSKIGDWMAHAHATAAQGFGSVACLVPARTDTRWFWRHALAGEVLLLPGRLKFGGGKHSAPFPSCLVILRAGLPWWSAGVRAWDWRAADYAPEIAEVSP